MMLRSYTQAALKFSKIIFLKEKFTQKIKIQLSFTFTDMFLLCRTQRKIF